MACLFNYDGVIVDMAKKCGHCGGTGYDYDGEICEYCGGDGIHYTHDS